MMKPRVLAFLTVAFAGAPLFVWLLAEALIRTIPDCKVQMYGDNLCLVGTVNLAVPLLVAGIGGLGVFLVLAPVVAVIVLMYAFVRKRRADGGENAA